jgi:hypothetical protein
MMEEWARERMSKLIRASFINFYISIQSKKNLILVCQISALY